MRGYYKLRGQMRNVRPREPNTIFPIGECLRVVGQSPEKSFIVFIFRTNIEIECDTLNEIASSSSSAVNTRIPTELLHRHAINSRTKIKIIHSAQCPTHGTHASCTQTSDS